MTCNGNCCENFVLPSSKEMLNRDAQQGKTANGSQLEMKMIANMVIPIQNESFMHEGKRYFWYTCKNFDKQTRKCTIYEKRPVLCRTYPDHPDQPTMTCANCTYNGCDMPCGTGTPSLVARK